MRIKSCDEVNSVESQQYKPLRSGSDVSVNGSNRGFPYLVDDRHRALVYKFFDAAVHPAYAVVDHCMRFAALLPAVASQSGGATVVDVITALLRNTTQVGLHEALRIRCYPP